MKRASFKGRGLGGVALMLLFLPLSISAVHAQEAMYIDDQGKVGIGTNSPSRRLEVVQNGNGSTAIPLKVNNPDGKVRFALGSSGTSWTFDNQNGRQFNISKGGSGVNELVLDDQGNLTITGTLSQGSSRASKEHIRRLDPDRVLEGLGSLGVFEWSYSGKDARHYGPMAEDFHALFGLGQDARHLAPGDLAGVAVASAKALDSRTRAFQEELEEKEARIEALEKANLEMRRRLAELTEQVHRALQAKGPNSDKVATILD